ncbi:MAG: class I SAM-dependent methyltransferase [Rhodocyclaceae bacterium]|nr:MAG: class I SAM-dependent methyltransferase [Rhodocyclaceae bacterium]
MAESGFLSRTCPVCGSKAPPQASVHSTIRAESLSFDDLIPHWNGFFKDKTFFSYARCKQCDLLFAPVFFNPAQLERLYAQMPPNMAEVPIEALRRTQRGYFNALGKHSTLKGSYLEVGPDIGLFAENCVREGQFNEYWLFEPNHAVLAKLTGVVAGCNYHISHNMLGFSDVPDHSVDAAVMIQVLDHLLDPVATLRRVREKLGQNSCLLLVTHDESSLLRRLFGSRWPAFCLQHPQIYSARTTRTLLAATGFNTLRQVKTRNYFTASFLLKHLSWALGAKVKSVPDLGHITLGLKLGNILTIATPEGELR